MHYTIRMNVRICPSIVIRTDIDKGWVLLIWRTKWFITFYGVGSSLLCIGSKFSELWGSQFHSQTWKRTLQISVMIRSVSTGICAWLVNSPEMSCFSAVVAQATCATILWLLDSLALPLQIKDIKQGLLRYPSSQEFDHFTHVYIALHFLASYKHSQE